MKIRYSELFGSFQGEAEFTGMPSVWLRFFGCNLSCDGFGQICPNQPDTWELPYKFIDLSQIKRMEDLPVLDKGCDSGYSWSSRFKHLAYDQNESELAKQILQVAKEKLGVDFWIHPVTRNAAQLCFTGGEPMMQQKAMAAICKELVALAGDVNIPQVTIETNGTKALQPNMTEVKDSVDHLHFAISPKLFSVSGEKDAVRRNIIESYCNFADTVAMKFVVDGSDACWKELEQFEFWLKELPNATLWLMPCGATKEQQTGSHIAKLAEEIMLRGYNVAARVHSYIFSNKMGT